MATDSADSSSNARSIWSAAILVVVVAVCFGRLGKAEFLSHWDDPLTVQRNPRFNPPTLAGIARFWPLFLSQDDKENLTGRVPTSDARTRINHAYGIYAPLTYTLWGALAAVAQTHDGNAVVLNPWIFHCANIALHALSSLVVLAILRRVIKSDWPALAGAMLFAIHPIQVEAVAWISGMKDVLCGLLSLVAIWQYIAVPNLPFRARQYWLGLVAFVGALLSKPSAVTVPLFLVVMDILILRHTLKQSLRALWSWFAIAGAFAWVAALAQPASGVTPAPIWARPLIVGDSIAFYLRQVFWPVWFALDYGRNPATVMQHVTFYVAWLLPAALIAVAVLARTRSPIPLSGLLIFILAPLPTLGMMTFLFQTYSTVADHYLYVAMLGPAMVFAWILSQYQSRALYAVATVALALLALRTITLEASWHNDEALFAYVIEVNRSSFLARNNLGDICAANGQLDQAEVEFLAANRANPSYLPALKNLAHLADLRGRADEAAHWRARIQEVESRLPADLDGNPSSN